MQRKKAHPYLLVLPALLYIGVWILYPMAKTFYLSFFSAPMVFSTDYFYVGLQNFSQMITDSIFWLTLRHAVLWVLLTLAIPFMVGLALAQILAYRRTRLFYATIYFIPMTISFIIAATVWGWIYNPVFGGLNIFLESLGLRGFTRQWLADPNLALFCLNMIGSWGYFGFCTLIILSAYQGVNPSLHDAAKVDGANSLQRFLHVTLPSIKYTLYFLLVFSVIAAMKTFDLVFVSTKGGPHHATEIVAVYVFHLLLVEGEINYAATLSATLTLIILVLTVFMTRFLYRKEA